MDKLLIVSGDNHAAAQPADYRPFIESRYHDALKELETEQAELLAITGPFSTFSDAALDAVDGERAIRDGGLSGSWDVQRRVAEMDREGVAAEIVHAGTQSATLPFFSQVNKRHSVDYRAAGARAYHRWFAASAAPFQGRIYGVGDPGPCHDMKETVGELHWLADNGFVGVGPPGIIKDVELPPLFDRRYDAFWAACEERSLALQIHAGYGIPQGSFFDFAAKVAADRNHMVGVKPDAIQDLIQKLKESRESPFYLEIRPRRAFWQMILGGVFDRFPKLRVVFAEVRADWIPGTLDYLDRRFEAEGCRTALKPSEYFVRNGYVTPSSLRPSEVALRHELGVNRLMFGVDYPHPEGTWPNTGDWIRTALAGIPLDETRAILGGNAVRCYGLDDARLAAVTERIGLTPEQIFGVAAPVDSRVIDHFQQRAGFNDQAEAVDTELLDVAVGEDVARYRTAA